MKQHKNTMTAEEITGIIAGVTSGMVAVIGAIGTIINNKRRDRDPNNATCCMTGRKLKPRNVKRTDNNNKRLKKTKERADV